MPTAKQKRQVIWLFLSILIPILIITGIINIGVKIRHNAAQKALAERLLKDVKGAVVDKYTSYVICPPKVKYILKEPVATFTMCDSEITVKKSWKPRLERANAACLKETGQCIKIRGSIRSNYTELQFILDGSTPIKAKKGENPEHKSCTTSHAMAQAVDVENFEVAHKFLVAEGFWGGWGGVMCDPWHYVDAKKDTVGKHGWTYRQANRACVKGKKLRRWIPW